MNWGKGIIGGMVVFMLFIIWMCVRMFNVPADEYDHQYYEKGLSFNRDYEKEVHVVEDKAQPKIEIANRTVRLTFFKPAVGKITFIRPSNQNQDKAFEIDTDGTLTATILITTIEKGKWRLLIEWESDSKAYVFQQEVFIK